MERFEIRKLCKEKDAIILAHYYTVGYPWFKCSARDTFISLPGLTLSIEENDYFELAPVVYLKDKVAINEDGTVNLVALDTYCKDLFESVIIKELRPDLYVEGMA